MTTLPDEIIYGAKFKPMYEHNNNFTSTILHIDRLNQFENTEI
ncbi:hypothetical protein [Flavobacterium columnare]|nr:hypothetical protein [Flavobacterium columnare]